MGVQTGVSVVIIVPEILSGVYRAKCNKVSTIELQRMYRQGDNNKLDVRGVINGVYIGYLLSLIPQQGRQV